MVDYSQYGLTPLDSIKSGDALRYAFARIVDAGDKIPSNVLAVYHDGLVRIAARLQFPLQWVKQQIPGYDYPLSPWQVRKISEIVDNHVQAFMYETMGYAPSSHKIRELQASGALKRGVTRLDFPEQLYMFGRTLQAIEQGISYQDARRLASATPIMAIERATIDHMRDRACHAVTGLGNDFAGTIRDVVIAKNRKWLQRMILGGLEKKLTYQQIASEIGHATSDWGRDLFRIVYTEGHSYSQLAIANDLKNTFGYHSVTGKPRKVKIVKVPQIDACQYCYQLYVLPDGSLRVFDLDEMLTGPLMNTPYEQDGKTIRRKASMIGDPVHGWVATLGATHPYCRCQVRLWYPHLYDRQYIVKNIAAGKLPGASIQPVNAWQVAIRNSAKNKSQ